MIRSTETGFSQPWDVNNTTTEFAAITLFNVLSNLCTTFGIRQIWLLCMEVDTGTVAEAMEDSRVLGGPSTKVQGMSTEPV